MWDDRAEGDRSIFVAQVKQQFPSHPHSKRPALAREPSVWDDLPDALDIGSRICDLVLRKIQSVQVTHITPEDALRRKLQRFFNILDRDKDGEITRDE